MGQVSITVNDRVYRLVCDDGDEDRLVELATYVKSKVAGLTEQFGHAGDERLMLMAALLVADELYDARAERDAAVGALADHSQGEATCKPEAEPVRRLKKVAAEMAAMTSGTHAEAAGGTKTGAITGAPPAGAPSIPGLRRRNAG